MKPSLKFKRKIHQIEDKIQELNLFQEVSGSFWQDVKLTKFILNYLNGSDKRVDSGQLVVGKLILRDHFDFKVVEESNRFVSFNYIKYKDLLSLNKCHYEDFLDYWELNCLNILYDINNGKLYYNERFLDFLDTKILKTSVKNIGKDILEFNVYNLFQFVNCLNYLKDLGVVGNLDKEIEKFLIVAGLNKTEKIFFVNEQTDMFYKELLKAVPVE